MPLHAAGDLLVGEAAVDVAGHAPVQLPGVRLGPHHEQLREERIGPAELRAQYLHTESLIITSDLAQNKNFLRKFTSVFPNNDWAPFH